MSFLVDIVAYSAMHLIRRVIMLADTCLKLLNKRHTMSLRPLWFVIQQFLVLQRDISL